MVENLFSVTRDRDLVAVLDGIVEKDIEVFSGSSTVKIKGLARKIDDNSISFRSSCFGIEISVTTLVPSQGST